MHAAKKGVVATAILVAAVLLWPTPLAPVREAQTQLPPDFLVRAAATRDSGMLELAFKERADLNASDAEGRTALAVAVSQRDRPTVLRLLALGAQVDLPDRAGRTPLMIAAENGDLETLSALLARSVHPELRDVGGYTAAHYAILGGQYGAFDLLLPRLPEDDESIADDRGLLAVALDCGDARMIKAIVNRLADNSEWTAHSRNALRVGLDAGDADLTRILLCKHRGPPTVDGSKVPLLAAAIADGDSETFRGLLAAGADPDTVLPKPSEKAFVARLSSEFLRDYVRGDDGVTVLMLAAGLGKSEYVRALLEAGAARNRATKRHKMLALYFAARSRETRCVQLLLGRGPTREELRIEISLATQKAALIKDGVPVLSTAVSTGRKGYDTPAGEYVVTDKKRNHVSSLYHVSMPYFMRLNCLDFGMHAGAVPNYPASHGCIRIPAEAAEKIFTEIPVGTVVTIN